LDGNGPTAYSKGSAAILACYRRCGCNLISIRPSNCRNYTASSYFICSEWSAVIEYPKYALDGKSPRRETLVCVTGYGWSIWTLFHIAATMRHGTMSYKFATKISCNIIHVCFTLYYSMQVLGLWVKTKAHEIRTMDDDESVVGYIYTHGRLGYIQLLITWSHMIIADKALYGHRRKSNFIHQACHIAKSRWLVSRHFLLWSFEDMKARSLGGSNYYISMNERHWASYPIGIKEKLHTSSLFIASNLRHVDIRSVYTLTAARSLAHGPRTVVSSLKPLLQCAQKSSYFIDSSINPELPSVAIN
jgi:hypothetical protein